MIYQESQFTVTRAGILVAELSTLRIRIGLRPAFIDIKINGRVVHFNFRKTDFDLAGEETGYRYTAVGTSYSVLLIND